MEWSISMAVKGCSVLGNSERERGRERNKIQGKLQGAESLPPAISFNSHVKRYSLALGWSRISFCQQRGVLISYFQSFSRRIDITLISPEKHHVSLDESYRCQNVSPLKLMTERIPSTALLTQSA